MNYQEFTVETFDGVLNYIQIDNGDGSFKSFSSDEKNPEYVAFLAQLEAEETE